MVGLDLSAALLRRAREIPGIHLVRADMRALPIRPGAMDLTVNLFTSFGYFATDGEHALALAEMSGTLREGGWFVIDYLNDEQVRRVAGRAGNRHRRRRLVRGDPEAR